MSRVALSLAVGIVFGAGLEIARMTNPAKVQNFLDLFGRWDPSLALVMGAALAVSTAGTWLARRRPHPWLAETFAWPSRTDLDARLLGGAALFGVGWGLAGFCPGPALANLFRLDARVLLFVAAMIAGIGLYRGVTAFGQGLHTRAADPVSSRDA
jgi:uncharacterized membrane protein YedE/YeeE